MTQSPHVQRNATADGHVATQDCARNQVLGMHGAKHSVAACAADALKEQGVPSGCG